MRVRSLACTLVAGVVAIPGSLCGQALTADGRRLTEWTVAVDSLIQESSPALSRTPGIVKYGKWGAAAAFVGAMSLGVLQHRSADGRFDDLRDYCAGAGSCSIGADGRYIDPRSEALYQDVVAGDRAARSWFIAGQVAFAGASALFIIQLLQERGTRNIPFSGLLVDTGRQGTRLGIRLPIRGP